jgi:hypothetical protein
MDGNWVINKMIIKMHCPVQNLKKYTHTHTHTHTHIYIYIYIYIYLFKIPYIKKLRARPPHEHIKQIKYIYN